MKTKWIATFALAAITAVISVGCRVDCRFSRHIDHYHKGGGYNAICHGTIVSCNGGGNCQNILKIVCDGDSVYYGPYTVNIKNNVIKYIASDWSGPDAPFIASKIPQNDHEKVDASLLSDDKRSEGSCRYDFEAN